MSPPPPPGSPPRRETDSVLIVEDDPVTSARIHRELTKAGYRVVAVPTARQAEEQVRLEAPAVALLDLSLPDSNDLSLFHKIHSLAPAAKLVIMTAMDDLDVVISATQAGAFDFITKSPDVMQRVQVTVRNAFDSLEQAEQVAELASSLRQRDRFSRIVGQSRAMDEVKAAIDKLAPSRVNVLITGPSGTGKEVVARSIHEVGPRAAQPFVAVNCAGIPDTLLESELFGYERGAFTGAVQRKLGKFEAAHGGTLFLDEIGEMSLSLQAKLLRVLQDGRFERLGGNHEVQADARIICATNRDLLGMVKAGTFREDLYYRIAVFTVLLPPLAARTDDIALLTDHFVRAAAREEGKLIVGVSPEVMRLFQQYTWPGNVRQLQNVVSRATVVCTTREISLRDLPESFVQEWQAARPSEPMASGSTPKTLPVVRPLTAEPVPALLPASLQSSSVDARLDAALELAFPDPGLLPTARDLEAAGIRLGLKRLDNNMLMTAKRMGMSRATLYRRMALPD
ncbi:MAG: sigma-54-dependent Fis family transcriptional regulator [Deltaproteobacteria bacterium]|nr:sigma-54-dependent Fis family transcriptional regulator [Deltaproteobacteria bacterium]